MRSVTRSKVAEVRWTGGEGTGSVVSFVNTASTSKVCSDTEQHFYRRALCNYVLHTVDSLSLSRGSAIMLDSHMNKAPPGPRH